MDSRIAVNQYVIDQEGYHRLPSFMSTEEVGLPASVKQQDVIEDELEVWISHLFMTNQVSVRFLRWCVYCIPSGPGLQYYRTSFPSGRRITLTGARAHTHAPVALRIGGIVLLCVEM